MASKIALMGQALNTEWINIVTQRAPFVQLLLLSGRLVLAAPDKQGATFKQLRSQLVQRMGKDVNAPSLLAGDPTFQP